MAEPDRATYEAAERLVREAHQRAEEAARAAASDVPPNGWASPGRMPAAPDWNALIGLLDTVKGTLPPDLARQLADALRELLLAIRAVLDYSIERLEPAPRPEPQVEDIPIR
jgi:hypothetical protein